MINVKERDNRYNCTPMKMYLTLTVTDTNRKGGGPNLEGSASQIGHEKVRWTVHYVFTSSLSVKPDSRRVISVR